MKRNIILDIALLLCTLAAFTGCRNRTIPENVIDTATFATLAAFTGCRNKTIPENVIDTATFASFLTEAHLINSYDYVVVAASRDSLGY